MMLSKKKLDYDTGVSCEDAAAIKNYFETRNGIGKDVFDSQGNHWKVEKDTIHHKN